MELDNLKALWREMDMKDAHASNNEQILSMLRKRSQSPIARMKRNLRWELIAVVVLYSATIWYYVTAWQGRYWEIALMMLVVGVFFLFYYYRKNKLLNEMQCTVCEVRSNLRRQLVTLEKYIRFYFVSGTLLMPIAYYVSLLIVFIKTPSGGDGNPASSIHSLSTRFYILFITIGVVITVAGYFFNIWVTNKMYGQHLRKLKQLLAQMEETEPA